MLCYEYQCWLGAENISRLFVDDIQVVRLNSFGNIQRYLLSVPLPVTYYSSSVQGNSLSEMRLLEIGFVLWMEFIGCR